MTNRGEIVVRRNEECQDSSMFGQYSLPGLSRQLIFSFLSRAASALNALILRGECFKNVKQNDGEKHVSQQRQYMKKWTSCSIGQKWNESWFNTCQMGVIYVKEQETIHWRRMWYTSLYTFRGWKKLLESLKKWISRPILWKTKPFSDYKDRKCCKSVLVEAISKRTCGAFQRQMVRLTTR